MKRIFAMLIDILGVFIYALVIVLVSRFMLPSNLHFDETQSNLIGLTTMILPVAIYFLVSEYRFGCSLGKKIMKLRVKTIYHKKPSLLAVLFRTFLFTVPWICGHAFVYRGFYTEWAGSFSLYVLGGLTYGLLILNGLLILFSNDHQGFHELISHTKVYPLNDFETS